MVCTELKNENSNKINAYARLYVKQTLARRIPFNFFAKFLPEID